MIRQLKKYILLFSLLAFITPAVIAQSGSAYTRIGIGDMEYSWSAHKLGMGQLGTSVSSNDFITALNPAGLNRITRTRIETGLTYNGLFLNSGTEDTYYGEVEFSGFTFGFPVSTDYGIGAAFGIIPYSNISYEIIEDVPATDITENYQIFYEGRGGLSKIFLGGSYTLPFDLTIGAYLDYYFGSFNYFSRTEFANSQILNAEYQRTYSPRGLGTTIGVISPDISLLWNSGSISDFRFGASLSITSELTTDTLFTSTSSLGTDTIAEGESNINLPFRFSAGLSFVLSKNYLISFDYLFQDWSDYSMEGRAIAHVRDAMKLSGGFEYRPTREPGMSVWEQIIWRAGLSYEQTQYTISGVGIDQVSVSGGFSFPLSLENTLDIGIQYAMRGTTDSNLYKENIVKLGVGISLGEIWFIRQEK